MPTVQFFFKPPYGDSWTMAPACGGQGASVNPAPKTGPCVYIIHNTSSNETYAGYAVDANHRWSTRTEAFHCMGIEATYGARVLCAYCYPIFGSGNNWTKVTNLEGTNNQEHLLVRSVVNGLLGVTTNTNTMLRTTPFGVHRTVDRVEVYLPTDPWGKLSGARFFNLTPGGTY
jgi:hypothetical protein